MPKININLIYFLVFICLLLNTKASLAQQPIKLNDVVKFELFTRGGGMSDEHRRVEVIKKNNQWISYQTKRKGYEVQWKDSSLIFINDSSKVFIKKIPGVLLDSLLNIIAKPDTTININLFDVNITRLENVVDTIDRQFTPAQKSEFKAALKIKAAEGLQKALEPIMMDDRDYYGITIFTKNNDSTIISTLTFSGLYLLPWNINNIESYDPRISLLFKYLMGETKYVENEKKRMHLAIVRSLYYKHFRTPFHFENFKAQHPQSWQLLGDSLTPNVFSNQDGKVTAYFKSSKLPFYVQIRAFFKADDTTGISRYKRYEDTLTKVFKNDNFLFKYLHTRPDAKVLFEPSGMPEKIKEVSIHIKKNLPQISNIDISKAQLFKVYGSDDLRSTWLWLPGNKFLLLGYNYKQGGRSKFMNILPATKDRWQEENRHWIILDVNGTITGEYYVQESLSSFF